MILHMENYCLLILLLLFAVSVFGSLARSDFNSTFSLMSYVYLAAYKTKVTLSNILLSLIVITIFMIAADVWAIFVQK
jgi:hypothetical protein